MIDNNTIYEETLASYTSDILTFYMLIEFSSDPNDIEYWRKRVHNAIRNFVKSTGKFR